MATASFSMKRNFIAFQWFFTSFDNFFPMIRLLPILLLCCVTGSVLAQETWIQMSSPTGTGRHHPITVANDQYGYVIAGQAGFASLNLDDVHRYDPAGDTWEQMEAFPGGGRGYGYGVSEGDNAFVGFGSNDNGYPTDWWRLDMASGSWTAMADFPGPGRNHPAMVLTAGKVFVGLGSNSNGNLGDWWGYDIADNTWEELAPFTAGNRHHPFYFGIDGTAYVGFGHGDTQNGNLTIYRDFHAYNPANNSWTQLGDFPGEARVAGTQFAAQGKGYVLSGDGDDHGPLDNGEFWEYDPQSDNWSEMPTHPGGARWDLEALCWDVMFTSQVDWKEQPMCSTTTCGAIPCCPIADAPMRGHSTSPAWPPSTMAHVALWQVAFKRPRSITTQQPVLVTDLASPLSWGAPMKPRSITTRKRTQRWRSEAP